MPRYITDEQVALMCFLAVGASSPLPIVLELGREAALVDPVALWRE